MITVWILSETGPRKVAVVFDIQTIVVGGVIRKWYERKLVWIVANRNAVGNGCTGIVRWVRWKGVGSQYESFRFSNAGQRKIICWFVFADCEALEPRGLRVGIYIGSSSGHGAGRVVSQEGSWRRAATARVWPLQRYERIQAVFCMVYGMFCPYRSISFRDKVVGCIQFGSGDYRLRVGYGGHGCHDSAI